LKGSGKLNLYYGESLEEAIAEKKAETYDIIDLLTIKDNKIRLSTKGFRYINVVPEAGASYDSISTLYQYLPLERRGSFSCSDTLINKIYDTSYYTLELNTRQCFLDGIKRDRWVWSGDASQSYLMNFYSYFDEDVNKRTIWGLRGHDPVNQHINTILDYSFYWIISIYTHYLYTGNKNFVEQIYSRMKTTMEFASSRVNQNNRVEGKPDDWVFVDWAPITKDGELSFEQLLYCESLQTMKKCADIVNDSLYSRKIDVEYKKVNTDFENTFWSEKKQAYIHSTKNHDIVTRYTNIFSILFDKVSSNRKNQIKDSVLLNDRILNITTPYMKFYELSALCEIGEQKKVLDFVKSYWGGMLKLGATTFWETYDPSLPADKHYEMYGRPFGKSLCHAWGANPLYLFGRYYLGVTPTQAGYKTYYIKPNLGGLKWIKGTVPTPQGNIAVEMTNKLIKIKTANNSGGTLIFKSKSVPKVNLGKAIKVNSNEYQLQLSKSNTEYEIIYK